MIVVYKTNYITYLIGKSLIVIDSIALVNIVAGEKVVDELIQNDANENKIYHKLQSILADTSKYQIIKEKLKSLKYKLGEPGASKKAADIVYSFLSNRA